MPSKTAPARSVSRGADLASRASLEIDHIHLGRADWPKGAPKPEAKRMARKTAVATATKRAFGEALQATSPTGKPPRLTSREAGLSISYGEGFTVCACSRSTRCIGVDVEAVGRVGDRLWRRIRERNEGIATCYDGKTVPIIRTLLWTGLEAASKAAGRGIGWGLDHLTVTSVKSDRISVAMPQGRFRAGWSSVGDHVLTVGFLEEVDGGLE